MKYRSGIFAAILLGLCGCQTDDSAPLRISPEMRTYESAKIAVIAPYSGENSHYGLQMLRGAYIAAAEVNAGRGINGRPVEIVEIDLAQSPDPAGDAAAAGAVGVIAGYSSAEVDGYINQLPMHALPGVIPLATDDRQLGANGFIFRTAYTDSQQSRALAAYLWYWRQLLRIGVMVDMDTDAHYERRISRGTAQGFRDLGGQVVHSAEFHGDDFNQAIRELLPYNPQAIVVPAGGVRAAKIIIALREAGYTGIICGADNWDDDQLFDALRGLKAEGECIFVSFFSDGNQDEEYRAFRQDFLKEFNYEPGCCETQTFDAVKILCSSLNGAATINAFTRNLESLRNYFGASAVYTMLPGGGIDRTIYINRIAIKGEPFPTGRMIRKFQYSKLESYRND